MADPNPLYPSTLPKQEPLPKAPDIPPDRISSPGLQRNRISGDPPPRAPGLPPSYGDVEYEKD